MSWHHYHHNFVVKPWQREREWSRERYRERKRPFWHLLSALLQLSAISWAFGISLTSATVWVFFVWDPVFFVFSLQSFFVLTTPLLIVALQCPGLGALTLCMCVWMKREIDVKKTRGKQHIVPCVWVRRTAKYWQVYQGCEILQGVLDLLYTCLCTRAAKYQQVYQGCKTLLGNIQSVSANDWCTRAAKYFLEMCALTGVAKPDPLASSVFACPFDGNSKPLSAQFQKLSYENVGLQREAPTTRGCVKLQSLLHQSHRVLEWGGLTSCFRMVAQVFKVNSGLDRNIL